MKIALIYPYIIPKADALRPAFERFIETYIKFPAGIEHTLIVAPCNGEIIPEKDFLFLANRSLSLEFAIGPVYHGEGRDIGCHQHTANWLSPSYDFVVFCSSQVHFHREGWLEKLTAARTENGEGIYGAMGSFENYPHVRTCFFGLDPHIFRKYPYVVNSREKSLDFESGTKNFTLWVAEQGSSVRVVYWDGVQKLEDCRKPENIFRKGDQSNCLVWDRHTAFYADPPEEHKVNKPTWEKLANGIYPPY